MRARNIGTSCGLCTICRRSKDEAMPDEPSNWDRATLTEKRATALIWEADDQELDLIIQIITDHYRHQTGRVDTDRAMTPAELRARLQRPAW